MDTGNADEWIGRSGRVPSACTTADSTRDQSYFRLQTRKEKLALSARSVLAAEAPFGRHRNKSQVRAIARLSWACVNAEKNDSRIYV